MRSRLSVQSSDGSPPAHEKRLRRCILHALRELRRSVGRRRTLSLPNLTRLFTQRWQTLQLPPEESEQGRTLGLAFIYTYYASRQPFRPRPIFNGNQHHGG